MRHGTAVASDRPAVDDTFDIALLIRFDSHRDLTAFEAHPAHAQAKRELLQPLAKRVPPYEITLEQVIAVASPSRATAFD